MANNEVELIGEWWDPSDSSTRWSGTLRIETSGAARLRLLVPATSDGSFLADNDYDVLHGISSSGKRVTLLRCFDVASGGPIGGLRHRDVYVNAVLLGFHAEDVDPSVFRVAGTFRHARSWHAKSTLRAESSGTLQNVEVTYSAPESLTLYESSGVKLKMYATLESLSSSFDDGGRFQMKEELRFELDADSPRPLSEIERVFLACRDLLSIACQDYCDIDRLAVYQRAGVEVSEATYYAQPVFRGKSESRRLHQMLFRFSDIADNPAQYFTRWLEEAERLRLIRSLYFSAIYSDHFVQARFLALTQALEAFHRRYRGDFYMPEEQFKDAVAAPLYAAIPKGLDASLVQSLKNRIKFGYEHSLRKRLTDLFNEHRSALEVVTPDPGRFLPAIVEQRNAFTHFPEALDERESSGEEFLGYNGLLQLLLDLCVLKLIGFDDEKLEALVARGESRVRFIRRYLSLKAARPAETGQ